MMDLLQSDTGKRNAYAMINPVGMKHGGSGFLVGTVISCDDVTDNTELELADSNTELILRPILQLLPCGDGGVPMQA